MSTLDINDSENGLSAKAQERISNQVLSILSGKTLLADEMDMSAEQLEAVYAVAYNTYQSKKYHDAVKMFGLLCAMNPVDYRFVFGVASCFQLLGEYSTALIYFQLAGGLDVNNPAPMLHSAECMLAMKDKDGARYALQLTTERTADKEEFISYARRAEVMLENIS